MRELKWYRVERGTNQVIETDTVEWEPLQALGRASVQEGGKFRGWKGEESATGKELEFRNKKTGEKLQLEDIPDKKATKVLYAWWVKLMKGNYKMRVEEWQWYNALRGKKRKALWTGWKKNRIIPKKVKSWWWMALQKAIMVNEKRKRMGFTEEDNCPMCEKETETIVHCLCECGELSKHVAREWKDIWNSMAKEWDKIKTFTTTGDRLKYYTY